MKRTREVDVAVEVTKRMSAQLAGVPLEIALGATADLVAILMAQLPAAELERTILPMWLSQMRDLIPVNRAILAQRRKQN